MFQDWFNHEAEPSPCQRWREDDSASVLVATSSVAAISDDGAANKMAQMGSIFTDGPLLAPPPSPPSHQRR